MVRIKKYGNRRLYDTEQSRYVNLEDLVGIIRDGEEIQVVDAKTNADLTREVLLQVLLEVQGGQALLPVGLLHRLVRYSGEGAVGGIGLRQLGAGLEVLDAQIAQIERQLGWMGKGPRERRSESRRPPEPRREPEPPDAGEPEPPGEAEPPEDAEEARPRESAKPAREPAKPEKEPSPTRKDPEGAELDALRARLAALEGRLKR